MITSDKLFRLDGKRGLIIGVANDKSIATACARATRALGADLAITYLNDKARPHVEPIAREVNADLILACDVTVPGQLESVFEAVARKWTRLDFLVHSIAFAPLADLHGRLIDSSLAGFQLAMDVSCHSFLRMARLAEPLLTAGGTLIAMTYQGADRVVPDYNLMGPVKAALESAVRYVAWELGGKGIRVHAVSPGPIETRAASGLANFDVLLKRAAERAPIRAVGADHVGCFTAFLCTDAAAGLTGDTLYADGGEHLIA